MVRQAPFTFGSISELHAASMLPLTVPLVVYGWNTGIVLAILAVFYRCFSLLAFSLLLLAAVTASEFSKLPFLYLSGDGLFC